MRTTIEEEEEQEENNCLFRLYSSNIHLVSIKKTVVVINFYVGLQM